MMDPMDDPALSMLVEKQDLEKISKAYGKVMEQKSKDIAGKNCWPVEWFPEPMPTESASGNSLFFFLEHKFNTISSLDGKWPPVDQSDVQKEDVLIFADAWGFCKEILEQAPPGRIGTRSVQTKPASQYTEKDLNKTVSSHPWDLILFAVGIDPPNGNSVEDVHKQQDAVAKMLFTILKKIAEDPSRCKRLCVITVDTFAEEREIHEECGIGLITNATLYGMINTARTEIPAVPMQFIDTEWALRTESTKYLTAEIFRHHSFGHNAVRILNRGRYVQRQVPSAAYEKQAEFQIPDDGVIAISGGNGALGLVMGKWLLQKAQLQGKQRIRIKFLSRSMKVSADNMPLWKQIEDLAAQIGIEVEHARCDVSKPESVDEFIASVTPNLTGFIHSAGILEDGMLMNQTWEKFDAVFEAKSRAALFLHDALERFENPRLKFFWLFSSTAVYGNMGQINYSSSNAFLDALARHRRALGKPCMAPQWGAWGEVGMASHLDENSKRRMANSPMPYFTNAEGLNGLECGLRTGLPYFSVYKINPTPLFGMIQGDDVAAQCYARNFYSYIVPPPPSDLQKNPYLMLSHEGRKECHKLHKGLVFRHQYPNEAEFME